MNSACPKASEKVAFSQRQRSDVYVHLNVKRLHSLLFGISGWSSVSLLSNCKMIVFYNEMLDLFAPWSIIAFLVIGAGIVTFVNQKNIHEICEKNALIIKLLERQVKLEKQRMESENSAVTAVYDEQEVNRSIEYFDESEGDAEFSSECSIPVFDSDDEINVEHSLSLSEIRDTSLEYSSEPNVDVEWELYKIQRAPLGPVPMDQQYLTITCQTTGLYVKAVVDEFHTLIRIFTYNKDEKKQWSWTPTICNDCIQKIRCVLADGQCTVPYAIDVLSNKEETLMVVPMDPIEDDTFYEE